MLGKNCMTSILDFHFFLGEILLLPARLFPVPLSLYAILAFHLLSAAPSFFLCLITAASPLLGFWPLLDILSLVLCILLCVWICLLL